MSAHEETLKSDLMDRLFPKTEPITTHLGFAQGQFDLLANEARKFGPNAKLLAITGGKTDQGNYIFFQGPGIPTFQVSTSEMKNVQLLIEFVTQASPKELIKFLSKKTNTDQTNITFTHLGYRSRGFNQFRHITTSISPQVTHITQSEPAPTKKMIKHSIERQPPTQDHYLPEEVKLPSPDQKTLEQIDLRVTKKIVRIKHDGKLSINGKVLTDDKYLGTKEDFLYLSDSVDSPGIEVQDTMGIRPPTITFGTAIKDAIENKNNERDSLPIEMDAQNHAIILISKSSDKKRVHILHRSAETDTISRPNNAAEYFFDISLADYQSLIKLIQTNELRGYEAMMQTFFTGCDPASKRLPISGLVIIDLDQYLARATPHQSSIDYKRGYVLKYINQERIAERLNGSAVITIENKLGESPLPNPKKS
jgi:hypothetical protein